MINGSASVKQHSTVQIAHLKHSLPYYFYPGETHLKLFGTEGILLAGKCCSLNAS
jgi:hypothetical protein